ncbi:short-chain dehydrogenase TIC 32, chloroplastic-like [Rhododendron vialii]|uniref:short-chain dehydrogenase TIC 32, chloroplastic-like n=1 Tax=Rhododendron vialii TaxID=182163 RepID=UPI00265D9B2E|nr:short-chain dehydrogenase TIC 32, chloroplastic-like [Rhododendron vialii]
MWIFGRKSPSGFSASSTAEEVTQGIDGTGLTAIVTGASSGIGTETTRVLALRGVHVVMAVRNTDKGGKVREAILKENPSATIDVMELDLSSMASVRKFASEYTCSGLPLNILINNAGAMVPFMLTQDNIEMQFGTNHIGHFLLTNLLLETMKSTALESQREGRIVNVSSLAHRLPYREGIRFEKINDESSYRMWLAYGQSKLANILHANELAKRLKEQGVKITSNSLHPGTIATNFLHQRTILSCLVKTIAEYMGKNLQQGTATTCYVVLHPQVKGVSGEFFSDCNIAKQSALAKDEELAKKLWDFSLSLTNTK